MLRLIKIKHLPRLYVAIVHCPGGHLRSQSWGLIHDNIIMCG